MDSDFRDYKYYEVRAWDASESVMNYVMIPKRFDTYEDAIVNCGILECEYDRHCEEQGGILKTIEYQVWGARRDVDGMEMIGYADMCDGDIEFVDVF